MLSRNPSTLRRDFLKEAEDQEARRTAQRQMLMLTEPSDSDPADMVEPFHNRTSFMGASSSPHSKPQRQPSLLRQTSRREGSRVQDVVEEPVTWALTGTSREDDLTPHEGTCAALMPHPPSHAALSRRPSMNRAGSQAAPIAGQQGAPGTDGPSTQQRPPVMMRISGDADMLIARGPNTGRVSYAGEGNADMLNYKLARAPSLGRASYAGRGGDLQSAVSAGPSGRSKGGPDPILAPSSSSRESRKRMPVSTWMDRTRLVPHTWQVMGRTRSVPHTWRVMDRTRSVPHT